MLLPSSLIIKNAGVVAMVSRLGKLACGSLLPRSRSVPSEDTSAKNILVGMFIHQRASLSVKALRWNTSCLT